MKKLIWILIIILISTAVLADEFSRGLGEPIELSVKGRATSVIKDKIFYNPLTYLFVFITIFYIPNYKKTKKHNIFLALVIALPIFILISPSNLEFQIPRELNIDWQEEYKLGTAGLSKEYFEENEYYDFSSTNIQSVIKDIKSESDNEYEAINGALNYVYTNIVYNRKESDKICFDSKSSEIISTKSGQCDTQSIALISILRGLGFAARPVVGCIYKNKLCLGIQSIGVEQLRPPVIAIRNITSEDIIKGYIGRGGSLHAWVEVYTSQEGWLILEATAGEIVKDSCYTYNIELYPKEKKDICVSKDFNYADFCLKQ